MAAVALLDSPLNSEAVSTPGAIMAVKLPASIKRPYTVAPMDPTECEPSFVPFTLGPETLKAFYNVLHRKVTSIRINH